MNSDTFANLVDIGAKVAVFAVFAAAVSMCSTKSDVPKNADGTCDLTAPRTITFKTLDSCGDECTSTRYHTFNISSAPAIGAGKEVVTISKLEDRATSEISRKGTFNNFRYEVGGETLDASRTTQHNILGYKTDPKKTEGDIAALDAGWGKATQTDGFRNGLALIKQIEGRAKCTMPKPSKPGTFAPGTGTW